MSNERIGISIEGNAADIRTALDTLFGRAATAPVTAQVPNGATVAYGTASETVPVEDGDSVASLFSRAAPRLGLDTGRALTYQDGSGNVVDGDDPAVAGQSYTAVVNHDNKG